MMKVSWGRAYRPMWLEPEPPERRKLSGTQTGGGGGGCPSGLTLSSPSSCYCCCQRLLSPSIDRSIRTAQKVFIWRWVHVLSQYWIRAETSVWWELKELHSEWLSSCSWLKSAAENRQKLLFQNKWQHEGTLMESFILYLRNVLQEIKNFASTDSLKQLHVADK